MIRWGFHVCQRSLPIFCSRGSSLRLIAPGTIPFIVGRSGILRPRNTPNNTNSSRLHSNGEIRYLRLLATNQILVLLLLDP